MILNGHILTLKEVITGIMIMINLQNFYIYFPSIASVTNYIVNLNYNWRRKSEVDILTFSPHWFNGSYVFRYRFKLHGFLTTHLNKS